MIMNRNFLAFSILIAPIICLTEVSSQQQSCLGSSNYCPGQLRDMKSICKDGYCFCTGQDYDYETCLRKLNFVLVLTNKLVEKPTTEVKNVKRLHVFWHCHGKIAFVSWKKNWPISDIGKRGRVHRIVVKYLPQTDWFFSRICSHDNTRFKLNTFRVIYLKAQKLHQSSAIDSTFPWLIIWINAWSLKYTESIGK